MRAKSQNNQFLFNLPQGFVDKDLEDKFQTLLEKNFVPYSNIIDYISSTIKQIVFPSVSYETVNQTLKHGKKVRYRESGNVMDKFQGELDVIFKSVDSHLNYFMMLELSTSFYLKGDNYLPELTIHVLDKDGDIIYTVVLSDVIVLSLSELQLSYNSSNFSEQTFSFQISYNKINIHWGIGYDEEDDNINKEIYDVDTSHEGNPRDMSGLEKQMKIRKIDSQNRINE